jgi:hypothetical protein
MSPPRSKPSSGPNKWTHPAHASVRSQNLASGVVSGPLTNKRIDHYRRIGYYGTEEQQKVLAEDKTKALRKTARAAKPSLPSYVVFDILHELDSV